MHGSDWLALLRKIPTDLHDALAVTLTNGAELVVQQIYRLDREHMVLKVRISGTTDGIRVAVVPYHQVAFVSVMKLLPEGDIATLFGRGIAAAGPPRAAERSETPQIEEEPRDVTPVDFDFPAGQSSVSPSAPSPPETEAPSTTAKPGQVSKSILLARLRERLGQKTK